MKKRGLLCKRFGTVVLNSSDDIMVRNIAEAIDIVTKERYGKSTSWEFGSTNVTVITTKTTAKTFKKIRGMIEQSYPNTCIFVQWIY